MASTISSRGGRTCLLCKMGGAGFGPSGYCGTGSSRLHRTRCREALPVLLIAGLSQCSPVSPNSRSTPRRRIWRWPGWRGLGITPLLVPRPGRPRALVPSPAFRFPIPPYSPARASSPPYTSCSPGPGQVGQALGVSQTRCGHGAGRRGHRTQRLVPGHVALGSWALQAEPSACRVPPPGCLFLGLSMWRAHLLTLYPRSQLRGWVKEVLTG